MLTRKWKWIVNLTDSANGIAVQTIGSILKCALTSTTMLRTVGRTDTRTGTIKFYLPQHLQLDPGIRSLYKCHSLDYEDNIWFCADQPLQVNLKKAVLSATDEHLDLTQYSMIVCSSNSA